MPRRGGAGPALRWSGIGDGGLHMAKGFNAAACALLGAGWVFAAAWSATVSAGSVPAGKPESVGLSTERLQRVHTAMQAQIETGNIAGVVTLVARRGHIAHLEA